MGKLASDLKFKLSQREVGDICRKYHVQTLSLFGSAVRGEAHFGSDLDLLVEFEPGVPIGLIAFNGLAEELSEFLQERIDLVSQGGLKQAIRDHVLSHAEMIFAA